MTERSKYAEACDVVTPFCSRDEMHRSMHDGVPPAQWMNFIDGRMGDEQAIAYATRAF